MVQLLGGSFGVAIVGSLATSRYQSEIHQGFSGPLRGVPGAARPAISSQIGDAVAAAGKLPPGLAHAVTTAANRAFVSGIRLSAIVGVVVMALATLAAAIYIPSRMEVSDGTDLLNHPPV
jgi:DHA2 family multidrug resistance protein-like MFS transporter